jgi:hypothetical protein
MIFSEPEKGKGEGVKEKERPDGHSIGGSNQCTSLSRRMKKA